MRKLLGIILLVMFTLYGCGTSQPTENKSSSQPAAQTQQTQQSQPAEPAKDTAVTQQQQPTTQPVVSTPAPQPVAPKTVSQPTPPPAQKKDATVYVTKTGKKYHRDGCRYLSKSRIPIGLSNAKAQGYGPCSVCNPPN